MVEIVAEGLGEYSGAFCRFRMHSGPTGVKAKPNPK